MRSPACSPHCRRPIPTPVPVTWPGASAAGRCPHWRYATCRCRARTGPQPRQAPEPPTRPGRGAPRGRPGGHDRRRQRHRQRHPAAAPAGCLAPGGDHGRPGRVPGDGGLPARPPDPAARPGGRASGRVGVRVRGPDRGAAAACVRRPGAGDPGPGGRAPAGLAGIFPGDPSAFTALVAQGSAERVLWRTWHAYPQEGRLVCTRSSLVVRGPGSAPTRPAARCAMARPSLP